MDGTGQTYGDVIEQVWSQLRPYAHTSTYMGDDHREVFLHLVVSYFSYAEGGIKSFYYLGCDM